MNKVLYLISDWCSQETKHFIILCFKPSYIKDIPQNKMTAINIFLPGPFKLQFPIQPNLVFLFWGLRVLESIFEFHQGKIVPILFLTVILIHWTCSFVSVFFLCGLLFSLLAFIVVTSLFDLIQLIFCYELNCGQSFRQSSVLLF